MHVPSANCGDRKMSEEACQWKLRYVCERDFEILFFKTYKLQFSEVHPVLSRNLW